MAKTVLIFKGGGSDASRKAWMSRTRKGGRTAPNKRVGLVTQSKIRKPVTEGDFMNYQSKDWHKGQGKVARNRIASALVRMRQSKEGRAHIKENRSNPGMSLGPKGPRGLHARNYKSALAALNE